MLSNHESIKNTLYTWINMKKVPNLVFHGLCGSGKKTILFDFINKIYDNCKEKKQFYVLNANCAHGKGIKFIREELKLFSKTNISIADGNFKSVILLNADYLTQDAQSALRRCIELFSNTTRFFLVVENKNKLLKPILSRFCEIHVPRLTLDNNYINLYTYNNNLNCNLSIEEQKRTKDIKLMLPQKKMLTIKFNQLIEISEKLYSKGFSSLDVLKYIETTKFKHIDALKKSSLLMCYHNISREFRNEKLLILFLLYFLFIRFYDDLENITFI